MESKLRKRFDTRIKFIDDKWPPISDLIESNAVYCHLIKVYPLTCKEVSQLDLGDVMDGKNVIFDSQDLSLKQKIKQMP